MGKIVIDSGLEEFVVEDKMGNIVGKIYFNPTDTGIIRRFDESEERFKNLMKIDPEGKDEWEIIAEAEDKMRDLLDYIMGQPCSHILFSVAQPMAVLADGSMYIEKVLEGLETAINDAADARNNRLTEKIDKYARKYK